MIDKILYEILKSEGYIVIPKSKYNKFIKRMNKIMLVTPNPLVTETFFSLRGILIKKEE